MATIFGISAKVSVVSAKIFEPVLPGTLYKIIGNSVQLEMYLKCSIIPFWVGLL